MLAVFNGSIAYASGETGTYAGVETISITGSGDPFSGYQIIVLTDGSASTQLIEGRATSRAGPAQVGGTGSWKMVSGTGRFAGLAGEGRFIWKIDGQKYEAGFSG